MAGIRVSEKREVRRKQRGDRLAIRLRHRRWHRCFWTWPFGHAWRKADESFHGGRTCVGCDKHQRWVYDGMGGGWETNR